ncbi:sterigmatocystin 8-o-methyltransferase, partial [Colletotrichum musicola]
MSATEFTATIDHDGIDPAISTLPDISAASNLLEYFGAVNVENLASAGTEARQDLLIKARSLVQALETPRETMVKHCWAQ